MPRRGSEIGVGSLESKCNARRESKTQRSEERSEREHFPDKDLASYGQL